MSLFPYWRQQKPGTPLFPNIEWSKPEQKAKAGKLGIIGGNKLGFATVAESYNLALKTGVGEVRVLLPDILRRTIPSSMTDVIFGASNTSGSLSKEASYDINSIGKWANEILLIGDAGRNSETAILYENFIKDYEGQLTITRDAIDLVKNSFGTILERPDTLLIASFAQLQKIFQSVYYPKILTFSMQLSNLVETLHKFTITYPVGVVVLHDDALLIAHDGKVITTAWNNPMAIWRGIVATSASCYWLWSPNNLLEAVATGISK